MTYVRKAKVTQYYNKAGGLAEQTLKSTASKVQK